MEKPDIILGKLAADNHGFVTRTHAGAAGITRAQFEERVTKGPWQRIHKGVYRHTAVPPSWEGRLKAACLAGGADTVASHRSAARLYSLAGGSSEMVEITCRRWLRSRYEELVVHETTALSHLDITEIEGIPTTTVERTLLDLGAVRGFVTVQMALDRALKENLTTWDEVDATLRRLARPGRRGVKKLRGALEARVARGIPESEQETALLALLADHGFPEPVPQCEVIDRGGRFVARVDAAYPQYRIAMEYDSDQEHSDPAELARDNSRRNRLLAEGWSVISARSDDLRTGGGQFVRAVEAALLTCFASRVQE